MGARREWGAKVSEQTARSHEIKRLFKRLIALGCRRTFQPFPYSVALVVDEGTALAGRSPDGRGRAATDINDDGSATVYIVPRLLDEGHERQCGVLAHELGHVHLLQRACAVREAAEGNPGGLRLAKRLEEHSERGADSVAEQLFDVNISYDDEDIQTTGPGARPRPARLDRPLRKNPSATTRGSAMRARNAKVRAQMTLASVPLRLLPPDDLILADARWIAGTGDWWVLDVEGRWYWLNGQIGSTEGWMPAQYGPMRRKNPADDVVGLTHDEVIAWAEDMRKKLGLKTFNVYLSGISGKGAYEYLKLYDIVVAKPYRGAGRGTTALRALCSFADRHHLRVALTPALKDDRFGTSSRARLVKFYKRFGFVENKGRNKDFALSEGMYRPPQGSETRADRRARAARFGPKEAEAAWQAGRRVVREHELAQEERAWKPDYVRDRLKGAQGD